MDFLHCREANGGKFRVSQESVEFSVSLLFHLAQPLGVLDDFMLG